MILPYEEEERIQEILSSEATLERKAYKIESFYNSKIARSRVPGRKQEQPPLKFIQIKAELLKRGENLTPVDIEL